MLNHGEIRNILDKFGLSFETVTSVHDTSREADDKRLNYILDDRYVLKINSVRAMWEQRLQQIHRLILRYRSIGVYCPALIPTQAGPLSCFLEKDGQTYICYVEEFSLYPVMDWEAEYDHREVLEHLGILAAKYTGIDLSEIKSMWSIIDLAPLDQEIDEKQENTNLLTEALGEACFPELAAQVDALNNTLRQQILTIFPQLPRCVYQGDMNTSNLLHKDGHFVGLIDFNMAGTDVNINVFLNETNWFPEEREFDTMTVPEMLAAQEREQNLELAVILRHYRLNESERFALPFYQRIVSLFQWPNVCSMVQWLKEPARKDKCAALIRGMAEKPLTQPENR